MPALPPVADPAGFPIGSLPAAPPSELSLLAPDAPLAPASPALFSLPPKPASPSAPAAAIALPPAPPGATTFKSRQWLSRSALQAPHKAMTATHAIRLGDRFLKSCILALCSRRPAYSRTGAEPTRYPRAVERSEISTKLVGAGHSEMERTQ